MLSGRCAGISTAVELQDERKDFKMKGSENPVGQISISDENYP